jgi:hypothetical protein
MPFVQMHTLQFKAVKGLITFTFNNVPLFIARLPPGLTFLAVQLTAGINKRQRDRYQVIGDKKKQNSKT